MHESSDEQTPWWGTVQVDEESAGRWEVGPSTLWMYRTSREWRLVYEHDLDPRSTDPLVSRSRVTIPIPQRRRDDLLARSEDEVQISRYSFAETEARIRLEPALADRPVVSRPEHPLHIPEGELVTLFVSTPLWLRVILPETARQLHEIPSHRLSDTWFGTSTIDGEFCYATRTAGRLKLENLPFRLHRAVTPLEVKNRGQTPLLLERVQLPVRHLSLYEDASSRLWTETVRMTRSEGSEGAGIQVRDGAPKVAENPTRLQTPREEGRRGLFTSSFRAFGALFGSQ